MLSTSATLCVVLLLTVFTDGLSVGYKYYPEVKGWYKLHLESANWTQARHQCEHEGAALASPLNAKLLKAMTEEMADQVDGGVFTGIYANISKPEYYSTEGVPLSEIPVIWAPNEPDTFAECKSCLIMHANGSIADVNCADLFPYMCYKQFSSCGRAEYHLDTRTGSCYKFHRVGKTWIQAAMTCAAEGGYLTVINSELESQVIIELNSKFPQNVIKSKEHYCWSLYIGFQGWSQRDTWLTIFGETLQAAGFNTWHKGEPNNEGNEYCGSILRADGLLNDVACDLELPFICEKSPDSNPNNCGTLAEAPEVTNEEFLESINHFIKGDAREEEEQAIQLNYDGFQ